MINNMTEFSHNIPSDQLMDIFKNFFEQHMIAYELLKGMDLIDFKVSSDLSSSSIFYSVRILNEEDKERIKRLYCNNTGYTVRVYGNTYTPSIYLNGDLLCITFKK